MGTGTDVGPEVGAQLTYLLKRAFLRLERLQDEQLARHGVTSREFTVMLFLAGREPESQQQAAEHLGVDRTTMVGLLDSLEHKKLVRRQPDPTDRRRNVVVLLSAGRRTLERALAASDDAERRVLGSMSPTNVRRLRELLRAVGDPDSA